MPEARNGNIKEPLDNFTLNSVKREFDRLKKGTAYKRHVIRDFIDNGRFARVYSVKSIWSPDVYAIRISSEPDHNNTRELTTVMKLMELGQPHIVNHLMDFTVDTPFGKKHCTLMQFLCPLSKYNNTADDVELAVRCGNDLLPLLQTCMEQKILHRDIKPENILYDVDFRNHRGLMLGDFGETRTDNDGTVTRIGTPVTISPEIAGYDRDIRHDHRLSDMYSLGMVMFYYLNGRAYPFQNDYLQRLDTKGELPSPLYGSTRLKQLVLKATQYYPSDRFSSPQEMLDELRQCDEYRQYILQSDLSAYDTLIPDQSAQGSDIMEELAKLRDQNRMLEQQVQQRERELQERREREIQIKKEQAESARKVQTSSPEKSKLQGKGKPINTRVGRTIYYGKYPLGKEGKEEKLAWKVLDIKDGKALLITDKLIDCVPFNDCFEEVTWETCSLRRWLNSEFLMRAFKREKPYNIALTFNQNSDNPKYKTGGGNATYDRVFLLSIDELRKYYPDNNARIATVTPYARNQGSYISDEITLSDGGKTGRWWLRTPGNYNHSAITVDINGYADEFGLDVFSCNCSVRPAIWIYLGSQSGDAETETSSSDDKAASNNRQRNKVKIGGTLKFGTYRYGEEGDYQPINWRVLDIKDGRALVITEQLLDYLPYNESDEDISWKDSSLRKWLNGEFITQAFAATQLNQVALVTNRNTGITNNGCSEDSETQDWIFLLTAEEAQHYFSDDNDRKALKTPYMDGITWFCEGSGDKSDWWWLRSHAAGTLAPIVDVTGCILENSQEVNDTNGSVRPAMWLILD